MPHPETSHTLRWVRVGDLEPDLKAGLDHFIALDGEAEVGVVKGIGLGPDCGWFWSMLLTHPGPAFKRPTNGMTQTRGEAGRDLLERWQAFPDWSGIED